MRLARLLLLLALVIAPAIATGEEPSFPADASARFDEARKLKLALKHREAAQAYRSVADWPSGGEFKKRGEALYWTAQELELDHDLEHAIVTYRELLQRFPRSDFAPLAKRCLAALEPEGVSGGIDFRKRFDEARAVLEPAVAQDDRRETDAARPGLERAASLLAPLLRDHEDHPEAVFVAMSLSDALSRLHRFEEAFEAADRALALAEREAKKPGAKNTTLAALDEAKRQHAAVSRERRLRLGVDIGAKILLAVLVLIALLARPWRRATRRSIKLVVVLAVIDLALAGASIALAEHIRRQDADSPLTDFAAALLVLVPGAFGIGVSSGIATGWPSKKGAALAALAGVIAALAASASLVRHYGLYGFLPGN